MEDITIQCEAYIPEKTDYSGDGAVIKANIGTDVILPPRHGLIINTGLRLRGILQRCKVNIYCIPKIVQKYGIYVRMHDDYMKEVNDGYVYMWIYNKSDERYKVVKGSPIAIIEIYKIIKCTYIKSDN